VSALPLGMAEKDSIVLLSDRLADLEHVMSKFGLSVKELDMLMQNEYHHFACEIERENVVRVYTRACVFSINLDSARASVATSETVWMHAILKAREVADAKTQEATTLNESIRDLRYHLERSESYVARLEGEVKALTAAIKQARDEAHKTADDLKKWKSRCMRMVSKARKTNPKAKPNKPARKSRKEVVS
jgi:predicted RNase H-like nuclease (RuvC/YqgF family)